jgi:uncharacterized protein YndB with AHSA1/START domain
VIQIINQKEHAKNSHKQINHMEAIRHYVLIKNTLEKVFQAITTEDGLKSWWAKHHYKKL